MSGRRTTKITEGPSKTKALFSFNSDFKLASYWNRVLVAKDTSDTKKKKNKKEKCDISNNDILTDENCVIRDKIRASGRGDKAKSSNEESRSKWTKYVNKTSNKALYLNEETGEVRMTNPALDNETEPPASDNIGSSLRYTKNCWKLSDRVGSSLRCKLGVSYTSYLSSPLTFVEPFERGFIGLSPLEVASESFSLYSSLEQMPKLWQVDNIQPSVHKWLLVGIRFVSVPPQVLASSSSSSSKVTVSLWHNKKKLWEDINVDASAKSATTSYKWCLFGPLKRTLTTATLRVLNVDKTTYSHSAIDLSFGEAKTVVPELSIPLPPSQLKVPQTSRQHYTPQFKAQSQHSRLKPFFAARSHAVWLPPNSFPQTVYVPLEIAGTQVPVCVQLALYDREPIPSASTDVTIPRNASKLELADLVPGAEHRDDMYLSLDLESFIKGAENISMPPSFAVYAHVIAGNRRTVGPILVGFRTMQARHPLAECGKLLRVRLPLCKRVLKNVDSCVMFEFVSTRSPAEYEERGFRDDIENFVFAWSYFKLFNEGKLRDFSIDSFPLKVFWGHPNKITVRKEEGTEEGGEEECIPVFKPLGPKEPPPLIAGTMLFSYNLILYSIFKKSDEVAEASESIVGACESGDIHSVVQVLNSTNMYFLIASLHKLSTKFSRMLRRPKTSRRYKNLLGFSPLISRWVRTSKLAECPRMQEAFYVELFDNEDAFIANYLELLIDTITGRDEGWVHHVHTAAVVLRHITARLGKAFLGAEENEGVLVRLKNSALRYVNELCSKNTLSMPGGTETALWCLGYVYPYIMSLVSAAEFASSVVGVVQSAREDRTLRLMLARFIGSIYSPMEGECVFTGESVSDDEKGREEDESDVQNFLMGTFIETISQFFAAAGGSKDDVRAVEIAGARMLMCTPRIVSNERREEELIALMTLAVTVVTKCDMRNCACAYGLLNFFYAAQQCPSALCIGATYFVQSLSETSLFLSCLAYIWTLLLEHLLRDPGHARYNKHHRLARNVATAIVKVMRCLVDVFIKDQGVSWRGETDIPHGSLLYLLINIICPEQLPPPASVIGQKYHPQKSSKSPQASSSKAQNSSSRLSVPSQKQEGEEEESETYDSDEDEDDLDDEYGSGSDEDNYDEDKINSVDGGTEADNENSSSLFRSASTVTPSSSPSVHSKSSTQKRKEKKKRGKKDKKGKKAKNKTPKHLLDRNTLLCAMETCRDICTSMTEARANIDPALAEALYPGFFTVIMDETRTAKKRSKKLRKQKAQQKHKKGSKTEETATETSLEKHAGACAAAIALCEWRGPKRNLSSLFASSYVWLSPFVFRDRSRTGLCGSVGVTSVAIFCESLLTTAKEIALPKAEVHALERLCSMFHRHVHSFAEDLRTATATEGPIVPRAAWERVLVSFLRRGADPRAQRAIGLAALHSLCMCAAAKGGCTIACSDAYIRNAQYGLSWELSGQTLEAFPYLSPRKLEQHPLGQALSAFAAIGALDSCHAVVRRMKLDGLVTLAQHDMLTQQLSGQDISGVPRIHYAVILDGYAFPPALDGAAFVACIMPHVSFDMFVVYLRTCFGNDLDVVSSPTAAPPILKPMRRATVYRAWPRAEVQRWKTPHTSSASLLSRTGLDNSEDPFIRSAYPTTDFVAFARDSSPRPCEWTQDYEINNGSRMVTEPIPHEILHSKDLPPHRDRTLMLRFQTATELPGVATMSPAKLTTTVVTPPFERERGCLVEMCTQWASSKCADLRRLFDALSLSGPNRRFNRSTSIGTFSDAFSTDGASYSNPNFDGEDDDYDDDRSNSTTNDKCDDTNKRGRACCPVCMRRFCDTNSGGGRNSDDQGSSRRTGSRRSTISGAPVILSRSTSLSSLTSRKRAGTTDDIAPSPPLTPPLQLPSQSHSSSGVHSHNPHPRSQSQTLLTKDALVEGETRNTKEDEEKREGDFCVDLSDPRCGHDTLLGMVEDMLLRCGAVGIETCIELLEVEDARVEAMKDKVEAYSRKNYLRKSKVDPSIERPDFSSIRVCRVAKYGALREATAKLLGVASTAMLNLTRLSLLLADEGSANGNDAANEFAHHMELEEKLFSLRWQFTSFQSIATATVTSHSHPAATIPSMVSVTTSISPSTPTPSQPQQHAQELQQQATPLTTTATSVSSK